MKLISKENAIWERNNYIDNNNVHFIKNDDGIVVPEYVEHWNEFGCKTCLKIDRLCEIYYDTNQLRTDEENDFLINRIMSYEINLYNILKLKERLGCYVNLNEIVDTQHYLYENYSKEDLENLKIIDSNINDTGMKSAVWCSHCGARKPDIIK